MPTDTHTKLDAEIDEEAALDARAVYDWLAGFGPGGKVKVALHRKWPTSYEGFPCSGKIDSFEEAVTEDEIEARHGGGKFQIVVHRPNPKSGQKGQPSLLYGGARTFEIAGHPRLENLPGYKAPVEAAGPNGGTASARALDMAESLTRDALDRARDAASNSGADFKMMEAMMAPIHTQIEAMSTAMAGKDAQIAELIGKEPDTRTQDKMLDLYKESNTDHSSRIGEIRANHDSELRQQRQFNQEEITRHQDRFDRQIDANNESHRREIETMKMVHAQALESVKMGYEMRIDGLKEATKRTDRDLSDARTEVVALRAKKDVSVTDQLTGLVGLKNSFDSLMPAPSTEEKSTLEKAIEAIAGSSLMGAVGQRVAGAVAGAAPGEQMVPYKQSDGTIVQVPARYLAQQQAAAEAEGEQEEQPPSPGAELDPEDIAKAIGLIETAYRNNMDPAVVGASARNMVPAAVLALLKQQGVDHFLNNVAQLEDSSPLATVEGRMYVRQIVNFLLAGTTEGIEPEEAEPAPPADDLDLDEPDSPVEDA